MSNQEWVYEWPFDSPLSQGECKQRLIEDSIEYKESPGCLHTNVHTGYLMELSDVWRLQSD